jgi:hypothetical protein
LGTPHPERFEIVRQGRTWQQRAIAANIIVDEIDFTPSHDSTSTLQDSDSVPVESLQFIEKNNLLGGEHEVWNV